MTTNNLAYRRATLIDLTTIGVLLTEAAIWGKARGIESWWPVPFPEELIRPGVERGEYVLAERGDGMVGTLRLAREDPRTWGPQPPVAGYVHQFAVRRALKGQGIGNAILGWAATQVLGWGRSKLRLDCLGTNRSLISHYQGLGFREVVRILSPVPGEFRSSVLMEKDLR